MNHDSAALRKKKNSEGSSSSSCHTQTERRRRSYKFWVLAAILLLAIWSLFTGTITLKWSSHSGHLNPFLDDLIDSSLLLDDLDILEIEEREKVVKHMWDVYTHSRWIQLPKFWKEAFEAAYEELISDDSGVRELAVSEIAKMSLKRSIFLEPPPPFHVLSLNGRGGQDKNWRKEAEEDDDKNWKNKNKIVSKGKE